MSRRGRGGRLGGAVCIVAIALSTAGCGVQGLTFFKDDRIDITAPGDRVTEQLPFTLDWTARDVAEDQRFAIVVDRTPPPTGKDLAWLFRGRDDCKGDIGRAACNDLAYLARQGIYVTGDEELTIATVGDLTGDDEQRAFHEFTIILVDEDLVRMGEGAWTRQVEVER